LKPPLLAVQAAVRDLPVLQTRAEHFLRVLEAGKVSTNVYLRRLHNFALDMSWLPWPVLAKRRWPKAQFKDKQAITWEEHQGIVAREQNGERKAFYQSAWQPGRVAIRHGVSGCGEH
jgi:hypothetical protein